MKVQFVYIMYVYVMYIRGKFNQNLIAFTIHSIQYLHGGIDIISMKIWKYV